MMKMNKKMQAAEQFRRAVQMFAASLSDEAAIEVATVFDRWDTGKHYLFGDFVTYGDTANGDPQLYKVVQTHTSSEEWTPDKAASLYDPIGIDAEGFPVWSQPSGAHDAYNEGDIVNYNGVLYKSQINGNVYSPDEYPDGWEFYEEEDA